MGCSFRHKLPYPLFLFQMILTVCILCLISWCGGVAGVYFDCDKVNEVRHCFCHPGDDFGWDIQCPSKNAETIPISLKLISSTEKYNEASLRIVCNPAEDDFPWEIVRGMDFGHENISFTITSLEVFYCPVIPTDDYRSLLERINLNPEKIRIFTFKSLSRNVSSFPIDFLISMPNIEFLNLQSNQLHKMPKLDGLIRLQGLNLRNNLIREVPAGAFDTNVILQNIGLSGNRLSEIQGSIFPDSLTYLDLINNQISVLTNESFANLSNLQRLLLSKNPLQQLDEDSFTGLTGLLELYLDHSKSLSKISAIRNLPKLTNLSISYSTFSRGRIEDILEMTTSSEILTDTETTIATNDLVYSESQETTEVSEPVTDKPSINEYFSLDPDEENKEILLEDLPSLKILVLTNNGLQVAPSLVNLPNLTTLVLSHNNIKAIPDDFFKEFTSLNFVDMSHNDILEITKIQAPLLTQMDLSNNKLHVLGKKLFRQLKKLEKLNLANNKIEYVDPRAFENLHELKEVDLSHNRISFDHGSPLIPSFGIIESHETETMMPEVEDHLSPLKFCQKLLKINLSHNLITKVFHDWTFNGAWLDSLNLSHNKIKILHPRDLYFVSENVNFDLRHNEISIIDMDFADLLLEPFENKKIVVQLDGNPLHCDCHVLSFKNFAIPTYTLEHYGLRCSSPENLSNQLFNDVSEQDLICSIKDQCPEQCFCSEVPSHNLIKIDCSNNPTALPGLSSFTELHEHSDFELNFANRGISELKRSFIESITPQVRLINLSGNNLTSVEFLHSVAQANNITKFALADNPFGCDDCKFQELWWRHYDRIWDIKNVTCVAGVGPKGTLRTITFVELVKDTICVEEVLTEEIRWFIILLGVLVPLILFAVAMCSRRKRAKAIKKSVNIPDKNSKPKRIPIAELDSTKF